MATRRDSGHFSPVLFPTSVAPLYLGSALFLLLACGGTEPVGSPAPVVIDAGVLRDSGSLTPTLDAGSFDAGQRPPMVDAGSWRDAGSPDAGQPKLQVLYVSAGSAVAVVHRGPDGSLNKVQEVPAPSVHPLAIDQTRTRLYGGLRGSRDSVRVWDIDRTDGHLTEVGTTSVGLNPVYIALDFSDSFLLAAGFSNNALASFAVVENGLRRGPAGRVSTGRQPHGIGVAPGENVIVVPNTGGNVVQTYRLAEDGDLSRSGSFRGEGGPRHVVFDPLRPMIFVVNQNNNTVTSWDRVGDQLTRRQSISTVPAGGGGGNSTIRLHPSGRFLYGSVRNRDLIAVFNVDDQGEMESVSYVPTEANPRGFDVTPDGQFLYVGGRGSGRVVGYRIDQTTGDVTQIGPPTQVGGGASWVLATAL